ncbi:uncharacterized protein LTR77_000223 [Saxophila tyrrhenica]|uniref:Uncharacterized protein n=1 Tax=Saxophila tyrrhenica TaxID=1690608 RepID=A0AAV9PMZ3_9PEZI|nr:hypothetical protein LTR77_000223 [Saxophila tyrrhenica]
MAESLEEHATAEPPSIRPKLQCVQFLETHFEQGGVDKKGFEMLYRMVEMMSAIGWETHLIFHSKIATGSSLAKMEYYISCMLQGCEVFRASMQEAAQKATDASNALPVVDTSGNTTDAELSNDAKLFQMILEHFDKHAYLRLHRLSIRKPAYGLVSLVSCATKLYEALHRLCQVALEADRRVIALRERLHKDEELTAAIRAQKLAESRVEMLAPTMYMPPLDKAQSQPPPSLSKTFSFAEDELNLRRHARAATVPDTDFTTFQGLSTIGTRRHGTHIPRVFTGSFSQLETDMRKMQIHKIRTPEEPLEVKIRDFGATPLLSPCDSPTAFTPLQRREAMVISDTELQDRVINGALVTSRRPSTKERAQTIDSSFDLEAWLKQDSGKVQSPERAEVRRGVLRHRENTL